MRISACQRNRLASFRSFPRVLPVSFTWFLSAFVYAYVQLGSLTQTSCEGKIKFPASPTGLSERDQDRGVFSSQLRRRNLSQQVGRDGIREEAVRLLIVGWCVPRNCGESGGRWEGYIRGLRSHTGVTQQPDTHPPGDVLGYVEGGGVGDGGLRKGIVKL